MPGIPQRIHRGLIVRNPVVFLLVNNQHAREQFDFVFKKLER
jgi:hypothetical protein